MNSDSLIEQLPPDWICKQSKSHLNRFYYFNKKTRESKWDKPDIMSTETTNTHKQTTANQTSVDISNANATVNKRTAHWTMDTNNTGNKNQKRRFKVAKKRNFKKDDKTKAKSTDHEKEKYKKVLKINEAIKLTTNKEINKSVSKITTTKPSTVTSSATCEKNDLKTPAQSRLNKFQQKLRDETAKNVRVKPKPSTSTESKKNSEKRLRLIKKETASPVRVFLKKCHDSSFIKDVLQKTKDTVNFLSDKLLGTSSSSQTTATATQISSNCNVNATSSQATHVDTNKNFIKIVSTTNSAHSRCSNGPNLVKKPPFSAQSSTKVQQPTFSAHSSTEAQQSTFSAHGSTKAQQRLIKFQNELKSSAPRKRTMTDLGADQSMVNHEKRLKTVTKTEPNVKYENMAIEYTHSDPQSSRETDNDLEEMEWEPTIPPEEDVIEQVIFSLL